MNEKVLKILKSIFHNINTDRHIFCDDNNDQKNHSTKKTKIVYRFCNEQELQCIQQNQLDTLGSYCVRQKNQANNHKYQKGEKYLHFFDKKEEGIDVLKHLKDDKTYLCSYSIDWDNLKNHRGKGYYIDGTPGYVYDYFKRIKEYAVPISELTLGENLNMVEFEPIQPPSSKTSDATNEQQETNTEPIVNTKIVVNTQPVANANPIENIDPQFLF